MTQPEADEQIVLLSQRMVRIEGELRMLTEKYLNNTSELTERYKNLKSKRAELLRTQREQGKESPNDPQIPNR